MWRTHRRTDGYSIHRASIMSLTNDHNTYKLLHNYYNYTMSTCIEQNTAIIGSLKIVCRWLACARLISWSSCQLLNVRKYTVSYRIGTRKTNALVAYPQGDRGTCVPQISGRSTVIQKFPHFLTHNDAISGFTSQSLGLPTYACKTGNSTAIKLAPTMHQNLLFWALENLTILGRGIAPSLDPSPGGEGTPPTHTHPHGAFGASFFALVMIRLSTF